MTEERVPFIGDHFPKSFVHTTYGDLVLPDAFKGRWFILFSHPETSRLYAQRSLSPFKS
ncbi:hypothetical protein [Paenibacillus chungangensis]|uniref:Uncharacterized protein n=1 Tax=Paenibacillus chungangensis TaxID=696535 RepID=A0ABW3HR95_9BACL